MKQKRSNVDKIRKKINVFKKQGTYYCELGGELALGVYRNQSKSMDKKGRGRRNMKNYIRTTGISAIQLKLKQLRCKPASGEKGDSSPLS